MYCFYEGYISHDYAEVVTNHVLLTNAGMILREAWEQKKQLVKRQGEKAANRLMIPVFMIFGGILVMVIVPIFANLL